MFDLKKKHVDYLKTASIEINTGKQSKTQTHDGAFNANQYNTTNYVN